MTKIDQLKAEHVRMLNMLNDVHSTLRHQKSVQASATDDITRERARIDIGRAIHSAGRIQTRLVELKTLIKAENVALQQPRNRKVAA